jgi:hypothetical protein
LASRQIHIIPTLRISHPFFEACDPLVKAGEHVTVSLGSGYGDCLKEHFNLDF